MHAEPEQFHIADIEEINFYTRPISERNLRLISELKDKLAEFSRVRAEPGFGKSYRQKFHSLIDLAARAFGALGAESLTEFTGISASTIRKIRNGYLPSETTIFFVVATLTDACQYYLRLAEQKTSAPQTTVEWIRVPNTAKVVIASVSELLDNVLLLARGSNVRSNVGLSPIERAELVAVLETALLLLKAPLLEKSFFQKLKDMLVSTSRKTAERQIELGLSAAAAAAVSALVTLIAKYL